MNENASDENTVTGKAMGNLMGIAASAAVLVGSAYAGTALLGKAVKGVKSATGSIKKNAGQIAENIKIKKAMKAEIKNPSAETKYYRNIQNRTPNTPTSEIAQMDKQAANRTMISRERAKENLDILNDDLFYTLGEKGNDAAAIQTSLLEDKGGGRLGGIVDEQKLDMKDIKSRPKAEAEKVVKNDELKGQLSMFDDGYGNADKQLSTMRQMAKENAKQFADSVLPPASKRPTPMDFIPQKPTSGNGGNNVFNPFAYGTPIDNREKSVFTGANKVLATGNTNNGFVQGEPAKIISSSQIFDMDNYKGYTGIRMEELHRKPTIHKTNPETFFNGRNSNKKPTIHETNPETSFNGSNSNKKPVWLNYDRTTSPGYRGDITPGWVTNMKNQ